MPKPSLNSRVADVAPDSSELTSYDELHSITYVRLLDADKAGADWREVSRIVLKIDADREYDRAQKAFQSHLDRARWMTRHGYRLLLRKGEWT